MKWMTVEFQGAKRLGYRKGEQLQLVKASSMDEVIAGAKPADDGAPVALAAVKPLAAYRPNNIICIGANYRDHCIETGFPIPEAPVVFAKFNNTVAGEGDALSWPEGFTQQVDWEVEVGVVIGRTAKAVSQADALNYVFGYVAVNDVTARDVQKGDGQWIRGKSLDGFLPMAPTVVTRDEVADVQNLGIRCLVNGVPMQDSNTREMIFPVDYLISYVSRAITLQPGDILLSGTPAGVGIGRKPQVFLKRGDTVSVEVDGLGSVTNKVTGPAAAP